MHLSFNSRGGIKNTSYIVHVWNISLFGLSSVVSYCVHVAEWVTPIIKLCAAGSLRYPAALFLYHCRLIYFHYVFHRNSADICVYIYIYIYIYTAVLKEQWICEVQIWVKISTAAWKIVKEAAAVNVWSSSAIIWGIQCGKCDCLCCYCVNNAILCS